MNQAVSPNLETVLPTPRQGKVRDIYTFDEHLLLVATDRISAYDSVLEPPIPDKGKILHQLTNYWFAELAEVAPNHLAAVKFDDFPAQFQPFRKQLAGRSAWVKKAEVIPFECVARGYLAGSGHREYLAGQNVCGIPLPPGLKLAQQLPEPIFTPATKAETGHDENISYSVMETELGAEVSNKLRSMTLELYRRGAEAASSAGLILADTKFEFGWIAGEIHLIDEVLTPDSSRYWQADQWQVGREPVSVDKQFVRNWLDDSGWNHEPPPPPLPDEVVQGTRDRYLEAFRRITGTEPVL